MFWILILIGAAGVALTIFAGQAYTKWDHRRWQKKLNKEDLFSKIKAYGHDF